MKLNVSATRMELLRLKKRLVLARRGHKLLKDKRDELIRRFMELIHDYQELRRNSEKSLSLAFESFLVARAVIPSQVMEEALLTASQGLELEVTETSIMNIRAPQFSLEEVKIPYAYGFADTSCDLDSSLERFSQALPLLVQLAAKEKTIFLLSDEIEKTRRRVNALEYVLVPTLEESIHHIRMRLGELERSALTRLMKIKDIVRAH